MQIKNVTISGKIPFHKLVFDKNAISPLFICWFSSNKTGTGVGKAMMEQKASFSTLKAWLISN
jgi:hypothetical protein